MEKPTVTGKTDGDLGKLKAWLLAAGRASYPHHGSGTGRGPSDIPDVRPCVCHSSPVMSVWGVFRGLVSGIRSLDQSARRRPEELSGNEQRASLMYVPASATLRQ